MGSVDTKDVDELEVFEDAVEKFELVELQTTKVQETVQLLMNSVVGLLNLGMMKLIGKLGDQDVVVLIDSRAMHNFIAQQVVEKENIKVEMTTNYGV